VCSESVKFAVFDLNILRAGKCLPYENKTHRMRMRSDVLTAVTTGYCHLRCGVQVGLPLFCHEGGCGWRQNKPLKCHYTGARLHDVTPYMRITVIIIDVST
jgi:hypothetical protein